MAESLPSAQVAILLSTFNGAAYLADQLASFDAQDAVPWTLYWRDDGSSDGSVAMLEAFGGGRAVVRIDAGPHLGVTSSYMALLRRAVADGARQVAFADQDDVWLPHKLARSLERLADEAGPALYCSRQLLVDAALRPLGLSEPIHVAPGLGPALTQNIATGCTVMLNQAAAALVARSAPPSCSLHDWWSYLLITAAGGRVIADEEPTVRYRQHARNAVGAPRSRRRRALAALRRGPGTFMNVMRAHVGALTAQPALLSPAGARVVTAVAASLAARRGAGVAERLRVMRRFGLLRQTRAETWLFRCWFLLG